MKRNELQTILGYLNIGLAIAHNTGVTLGHFGSADFLELAQSVNTLFLNALTPVAGVAAVAASVPATAVVAVAN